MKKCFCLILINSCKTLNTHLIQIRALLYVIFLKSNLPGSLLMSKDSWRFSSYDIGLALSSSSESKLVGGTVGFFLFAPRGAAGVLAVRCVNVIRFLHVKQEI